MNKIFLLLFLLFTSGICAQELDMKSIRKDFKHGINNQKTCLENLSILKKHANNPVEKGYLAAYQIFMAKHTSNPFKKLGHFNKGKKMLENIIEEYPQDTELRYIRLCIQFYSPKFLDYQSNINEDKIFVMNNLYKLSDTAAKELIYNYLKGTKMYTDSELELLGR